MARCDDARRGGLQIVRPIPVRGAVRTHVADQTCRGVNSLQHWCEGKRRKRQRAFLNHLDIALGSQGELEVQLEIAQRLGFVARKDIGPVMNRVAEVGRMLNGLIESLQPDQTERM
jgi:four helix bundle protein